MSELLNAAGALHQAGLCVIPLKPRSKIPLAPWAEFQHRRPDASERFEWFGEHPEYNLAVVCGSVSGNGQGLTLVVLDFDDEASFRAFAAKWPGVVSQTWVAKTRRGYHVYLRVRGPVATGKMPGGEIKAEGSYVVAPPSIHPDGGQYTWEHREGSILVVDSLADVGLGGLLIRQAPGPAEPLPDRISEGERNTLLASLAGSMRRRGASYNAILAALLEENARRCEPPLSDAEVRQIAQSIARYAPAPDAAPDPDAEQKDYGHALVLGRLFQGRYRWAVHRGCWMEWTGQVWRPVPDERVAKVASDALRGEYAARIATTTDRDQVKSLAGRLAETCIYARVAGALNFLKGWEGILTNAEEWDRDPWLLNVGNGTLDLRTLTLHPHSPDNLCTLLAPVDYDPQADGTAWQNHVERFLPNPNIRRQVQRDLGLALVGAVLEEALPIWYGTGANGKTTTARVIQRVLGDYTRKAAQNLLIASKYERHPTEVADLCGSRLVFSVEVDAGKRLAEALVKDLTGGDTKKARYMRQDFFEFEQTFSIVLIVNHKPTVTGTDEGIWRRIRLVPWEYCIPDGEKRPQDEVVNELAGPAVLNWLLAGLQDWQQDHYWAAPEVQSATQEYRAEQDVLGEFLAERCELGPRYTVSVGALYDAYTAWASEVGEDPLGKTKVGDLLRQRGVGQRREPGSGQRRWVGIRLKPDGNHAPDGRVTKCDNTSISPYAKTILGENTETLSHFVTPADDGRCCICGAEVWAYDPDGRPLCERHALGAGIVKVESG